MWTVHQVETHRARTQRGLLVGAPFGASDRAALAGARRYFERSALASSLPFFVDGLGMPFFSAAAGNALTTTLVGSSAVTFFGGASGSNGFRIKSPFLRPAFARGSKRPTPAML